MSFSSVTGVLNPTVHVCPQLDHFVFVFVMFDARAHISDSSTMALTASAVTTHDNSVMVFFVSDLCSLVLVLN